MRPTGFNTFLLAPKLPEGWNTMALRNIKAFNQTFDIAIKREKDLLSVKVFNKNKVFLETKLKQNETVSIQL